MMNVPRLVRWSAGTGLIVWITMTLLRLAFYGFFNKQGHSFGALTDAFWLGARFDMRVAALVTLLIGVLSSLPFLNPFQHSKATRFWFIMLFLFVVVLVFFYVIDFAHYAYLSQRLNASVLNYLEDAGISTDMVWQSYPVIRLFLLIAILSWTIHWVMRRNFRRLAAKPAVANGAKPIVIASLIYVMAGALIFGRLNQYPLRWSDAFALGSDYKAQLALNPFESFFNTLKFRSPLYDIEKVREARLQLATYFGWDSTGKELDFSRKHETVDTTTRPPMNVVLVICESFSAYKSSMWGNPLHPTPFFDSLSQKGLFFENCFTPTYGTARGVWATITGLPDVDLRQTASRNPGAVDQQTVIDQFKGYERYYFIGGSPSWANIRGLLMNNISGLKMYEEENLDAPRLDVWGISDKNLFLQANKILSKEARPFFAIIQTADNHRPYTIPPEDHDFPLLKPSEDSLNKYGYKDQVRYEDKLKEFNAFRYTDYTFRKFMEAAATAPYFENTLFVFVGDHGIAGDAGKMFPKTWTSHRLTSMHVPLLFYMPSGKLAHRSKRIVSQIDVVPTIAGITGMGYTNTTLGRNLTDSMGQQDFAFLFDPDYGQIGVIKNGWLYRKQLVTGKEEMVSLQEGVSRKEIEPAYRDFTQAIYETAGYLLLNNKKKPGPSK